VISSDKSDDSLPKCYASSVISLSCIKNINNFESLNLLIRAILLVIQLKIKDYDKKFSVTQANYLILT